MTEIERIIRKSIVFDNAKAIYGKDRVETPIKDLAKAIEQYVIKARIENLQYLVDHSTTIINGKKYPELISKKYMRELIAELKKGIDND